ncbi:MAG: UPF0246 protein YaaA [uncultured Campylobacterales bacterium]|uniref:UPF0246 protein YaaA n=1 Tax=uncultured Campylobacterales bacterium TaxID=352960 RepID=A0A6S6SGI3_9BACT|nr:MAG: UPF0246 protein YaaA [uncultured Campylobacterales bacterium]
MKILFSPSEEKLSKNNFDVLGQNSFAFKDYENKKELIDIYNNNLKLSDEEISKMTGIKDPKKFEIYKKDIYTLRTNYAIKLYTGVAYKYLDFDLLKNSEQKYIFNNVVIFSNLFGAIKADDKIPNYKLKQGQNLGSFKIDKYYKEVQSSILDKYFKDEDILDLRAGVYEKFYQIKKPYITLKFLKEGKVVSHYSKAYRGVILRLLAGMNIKKIDNFEKLKFKNMILVDSKTEKFKTEYSYEIL